jgi:hypothetical protein
MQLPNLDFGAGQLTGWEGKGFVVLPAVESEPGQPRAVSSRDPSARGHKALLHRAFVVPPGAGVLRFWAHAVRPEGCPPNDKLDVVLMAAGKRIIPKQVRSDAGWQRVATLLPRKNGRPQEYSWSVAAYAGQMLRIVLIDEDERPGCSLYCSGFRLFGTEDIESVDFSRFMVRLAGEHRLAGMARFDSPHYMALSNADDRFSEMRLRNCELLYSLFCDHFRRKGFTLRQPPAKFMVAMFDTQAGFEAYIGQKMSPLITGLYHPASNRLVVYDYGQNQIYVAQKRQVEQQARQVPTYLDRQRYMETLQRQAQEWRTDANIGTIMHEAAHQLSFNVGLLNREADMPVWLAEGLATYCEPTRNGVWLGIGEPNPERLAVLAAVERGNGQFLKLRDLLESDEWIRGKTSASTVLLGYGQSWALFRMLMEEQPRALRTYLTLIYNRQIPERRLADFQQAFGSDLVRLEERHHEYIKKQVDQNVRPPQDRHPR